MGEGVKWVNSKAKSAWPSKAKEGIHSLLIISAVPWRARFITHNGFLERSTPSLWMSPPFPFFTSHTVQHNTVCYGISLWLVWVSCLVCVPPSSLCTPCSLLTEEHEKLQSPRLCASVVLSPVFSPKIQYVASRKPLWRKLIPSQSKPRQALKCIIRKSTLCYFI